MKKILIVLLVILVLAVIVFLRFSSPEDTWLCENGEWIKHGNPSEAQPMTGCVGLNDQQADSDKIINEVKINLKEEPVACTMDAKQCPNGSYVGRTGPNCEFVCP